MWPGLQKCTCQRTMFFKLCIAIIYGTAYKIQQNPTCAESYGEANISL